ncbi:MAG: patatin-like phospholipase family protein, partial [Spirochaetales bacterium]|nr:patatin-like phospholipase family protein [Spirochaetales bacterium]
MFNKLRFWKKPYCLVLGGGGNKGVYQMGVWQALIEDHININAIIGTSVGSVNAAFMASSDYERVLHGWMNMNANDVFTLPDEKEGRLSTIKEITKQLITKGGMDMTK